MNKAPTPHTITELSKHAKEQLSTESPTITLEELFPRKLMRGGYTRHDSITAFFADSPLTKPTGNYTGIATPEFNDYVQTQTVFDSWGEMLQYARQEWVAREWKQQYPSA